MSSPLGNREVAPLPGSPRFDPQEGRRVFQLAMQKSRFAVYGIAFPLAVVFGRLGFVSVTLLDAAVLFGIAFMSFVLFHRLYRAGIDRVGRVSLSSVWLLCDVALITASIGLSGGSRSPWYVWYLAVVAAAAFVGDGRTTLSVGLFSAGAYLALLGIRGEIRGFDETLWVPLGRLLFLFGAAFFCLRGIAEMKEKRRLIRRLRDEDQRRLEELTRLTRELDERSRQLESANAKILEANRLKSQFLANMSHELRTPLNSIIGFAEILSERLSGKIEERQEKFLGNILGSGKHLLGLINDLLDISKIEAGHMELFPEMTDPAVVAHEVRELLRGMAERKRIGIVVDLPTGLPCFLVDPVRLRQVLVNLLSNAVKFSPDGSSVTLRVRLVAASQSPLGRESLVFEVVDQGIGIAERDREVIFEEFRQADGSTSREYGGTGLGLALVRRFAELQRGSVEVESEPGRGSTFRAYFPVETAPGLVAEAEPQGVG